MSENDKASDNPAVTHAVHEWRDKSTIASSDVAMVIAQLDVLRETLPAITSSDLFPKATQRAVERASEMLAAYRDRLFMDENVARVKAAASKAAAEVNHAEAIRAEAFKAGVASVKTKAKKAAKK